LSLFDISATKWDSLSCRFLRNFGNISGRNKRASNKTNEKRGEQLMIKNIRIITFCFFSLLALFSASSASSKIVISKNVIEAPIIEVEVNNIDEEIKNISLVIISPDCNIEEAYKGSELDFKNAEISGAYSENAYKNIATFKDNVEPFKNNVDPFADEDYEFFINTNYDKKNYIVDYYKNYTYCFLISGDEEESFERLEKYSSFDELVKDRYELIDVDKALNEIREDHANEGYSEEVIEQNRIMFEENNKSTMEKLEKIKIAPLTCERRIRYTANKLIEQKQIPVNDIKNGTLNFNIKDFEELYKLSRADEFSEFAIRFENEKGNFCVLEIGTNRMQLPSNSDIWYGIYEEYFKKNVVIDYKEKKIIKSNDRNFLDEPENFIDSIISWKNASSWAEKELEEAKYKNLIPIIFNKADLTQNITRREFAHIAVTLYEIITRKLYTTELKNPFIDTDDTEVLKAYSLGITNGTSNNTFNPDSLITREELATMMARLLEKLDIYTYIDIDDEYSIYFSDEDEMAEWSKNAIYFMNKFKIMKGIDDSNYVFGVLNKATIEQSLLISKRIFDNFKDLEENTRWSTKPLDVGKINNNYIESLEDVSSKYENGNDNEFKNIDINTIKEVQVLPNFPYKLIDSYGKMYYNYIVNSCPSENVYYYSNREEDISYIIDFVTPTQENKKDYFHTQVYFILTDNTYVPEAIYINNEIANKIKTTFLKSKNIYLSDTAKLGFYDANLYKNLDYTEEEYNRIINLLSKTRPVESAMWAEFETSFKFAWPFDIENNSIWAYQMENEFPVAYKYSINDNEELVTLMDKINARKLKDILSDNLSLTRISVTQSGEILYSFRLL